ncbi:hypothetical protein ABG067_002289 [Albugo candida]
MQPVPRPKVELIHDLLGTILVLGACTVAFLLEFTRRKMLSVSHLASRPFSMPYIYLPITGSVLISVIYLFQTSICSCRFLQHADQPSSQPQDRNPFPSVSPASSTQKKMQLASTSRSNNSTSSTSRERTTQPIVSTDFMDDYESEDGALRAFSSKINASVPESPVSTDNEDIYGPPTTPSRAVTLRYRGVARSPNTPPNKLDSYTASLWTEYYDAGSDKLYYHNRITGESRWKV